MDIDSEKALERIHKHFPHGADLTLQVLKGHLLVEDLLREIFSLSLANPQALKGSQGTSFECHQIICLVEAITSQSSLEPWVWVALKKLNRIRNELAHNLEPKALDQRIKELIAFVTHDNPVIKRILSRIGSPPDGMEFETVILAIHGALFTLKRLVVSGKQSEKTTASPGHQ